MDEMHAQVVRLLERKLAEINAMPMLAELTSSEDVARMQEFQRKEMEAIYLTFALLPPDVLRLVNDVQQAVRFKLGLVEEFKR